MNPHTRSIILTGFMGTGKTAVGRRVAQKLEREFVDMDAVIESRQGRTIPGIFASEGEAAFRQIESDLCAELGRREPASSPRAAARWSIRSIAPSFDQAFVVCLDATADEILARVGRCGPSPHAVRRGPTRARPGVAGCAA